ncbi:hypothetical protein CHU98_g8988 [Xylaria longipes]|nr:hypothetical protein CHU98_g8988 [Xylaria longipes]
MATDSSLEPTNFTMAELGHINRTLSLEATNPQETFQGTFLNNSSELWEDIKSWIGGPDSYQYVRTYPYYGKPTTADLWKRSKETDLQIRGSSPIFIFLTVPDYITDPEAAWRSLLCTLICEVSHFVTRVRPTVMSHYGIYGDTFLDKYFDHDRGTRNVNALIELLSALRLCDYQTGYCFRDEHNRRRRARYVYVVVIDRIKRFVGIGESNYWESFEAALRQTLVDKMGAYILFVDETDS